MPLVPAIFSAACIIVVWWTAGNSLGLWLGGFGVMAILVPPFALRRDWLRHRMMDCGVMVDCVAAVWLIAALRTQVTLLDWLLCVLLLTSFSLAGFGLVSMLRAMRWPVELASAVVMLLLLGWLAAPVWLSEWMNDALADGLSRYHPLVAANSRLTELGIWLEHPIIYRHTVLGQDVAYSLPKTLAPAITAHVALGVATYLLASILPPRGVSSQMRAD